jgi:hypothetical protein
MKRSIKEISFVLILLSSVGAIMLSGCEKSDESDPLNDQIELIVITPQSVSIGVGEQIEFSTAGITTDGDTVETSGLGLEWNWWSTDPEIFTVDNSGTAIGQSPGEAFCVLEFSESASLLKFTGRDSAFVMIF